MPAHWTHPNTPAHHKVRDYAQTPLNVYWEMTQACPLACRHCRAEAVPTPHPHELNFLESVAFLRQLPEFGAPLPQLILTGGDPLERADLYELIDEARSLGIGVSITPAASPALTRDVLVRLQLHGVEGLGLSLDGYSAARHDSIRGVAGTCDRTLQAIRWAQELGMPLQVNTLVAAETAADIPAIYDLSKVATTEAPSYRRVALLRMREQGLTSEQIKKSPGYRGFGIRDGNGIMFVSHTGDIYPAGFLPLPVGNVRKDRIAEVYRNAPVFLALHDPEQFHGRCGACEYHALCGGSRARAFEATGDPLGEDPFCIYEPQGSDTVACRA
jgi:radical SAM protein with 4Fe4S-binding SPASM domain